MDAASAPQARQSPTSQRKEAYSELSKFTLALIQAMLRTGYYAAEHPEAQKSIAGLYESFRRLVEDRSELTYLIVEQRDSYEIAIEGYSSTPLSLYEVMMRGMAELFTPKFLDFFKRWSLLSFSIKADTSADDFYKFIELMSQVPTAGSGGGGGAGKASERLTQALADHNILHISTVFKHDMVGRERHLPWRVRLALTRLRRDLRVLPLYRKASPEQISRIKLQIIDDVIRPVRTPALLKDFLINYDLIAADISVLQESEVEHEICANLNDGMLVSTAQEIIGELEKLKDYPAEEFPWGESVAVVKERHLAALRDLATTLCQRASTLEHEFVQALVDQKVLSFQELPKELRQAVETRHLAETFIARRDKYLNYLRSPTAGETTQKLCATLYRIAPDLVVRSHYETLAMVLEIVEQGRENPRTARFFGQLAAFLGKALNHEAIISHLLADLPQQEKQEREHLVKVIAFLGEPMIPGLVHAYGKAEEKGVRISAFEALKRIGPKALDQFLARLGQMESDWAMVRHALSEVGEMGDPALARSLTGFAHHPNPHVRHTCLTALFKLIGPAAEEQFVAGLRDEEAGVRQTAVSHLGAIESRHPDLLAFVERVLVPDENQEELEKDGVVIEICRALARFTKSDQERAAAQRYLIGAIRPVRAKGMLGKLKKPAPRFGEHVEQAALEALATIGTLDAIEPIEELATADDALADAARAAIERIKRRAASTV
ncbi:MAG: HEAT repeat domain-containing protein [Gemmatimonadetes bacterium]|uniref:HEAT repeat domain-containing protein n=1 Tax=Candidatus Kutchimonas denitrificans TaxID=3056748 RepID=A0AAE5CBW7_9BACT|nr:HEAT repeat domain-containing protein [Gemmatimonadota bacterium]NIR76382.1 HEAT repeat domain-containing protein [Candidatus Kutchimonas denitrificans]NIS03192.1 HEAT repeat domain-containing protein [Gemmatimonadota bacterium]NIT66365.1 HEAT repeat domain-containing protein [Gemmatimonadota bacterium]NIU54444.1 hypothetical protein [Gemmatimonadota bacterium]